MNIVNLLSIVCVVVAAGGFVVGIFILFSDRKSGRALEAKMRAAEQTVAALEVELKQCTAAVAALQEEVEVRAAETAPVERVNMNTRGRVLWLHRSGQSVQAIASCLNLPLREVELLIKVHKIALGQYEKTA